MNEITLPEVVAAGIYDTRDAVRGREVTRARKTVMFELELADGAGGISYIDRESAPITERLFVCSKPGESRHTRLPYRCHYVHFMLSGGPLYEALMDVPHFFEPREHAEYRTLLEGICRSAGTGLFRDRLMVQSLLLRLLYLVCDPDRRTLAVGAPKRSNERAIRTVIEYIRENPTADLRLGTLAALVSFSPIHFHSCFRAATGRTLRDYVEKTRIDRAVGLLSGSELTLSEIAYECGFSSQSYFSYAFKRRMGATPREYVAAVLSRDGTEAPR